MSQKGTIVLPCKTCGTKLVWLNNGLERRPLEARTVEPAPGVEGFYVVRLPGGRREWRRTLDADQPPPEHLPVHWCTGWVNTRRQTTLAAAVAEVFGGVA